LEKFETHSENSSPLWRRKLVTGLAVHRFKNLGSGPDSDRVNEKELLHFWCRGMV